MERKRNVRSDKGCHRKLKDIKYCPSCKKEKPISEFYKRYGGAVARSWCINCEQIKRKENRHKNNARERARTRKRIELWIDWLKEIFGNNPHCQCCGIELFWRVGNHKNQNNSVVLDHRNNGDEQIKVLYSWLGDREINEKNKKTILDCDFGVLCRRCNTLMPTRDRDKWLVGVQNYINGYKNTRKRKKFY